MLANLREPFTPIRDVAEHIALVDLYGLRRFFVCDDEGSTTATAAATRSNSGIKEKEKEKEPVWSPMKIAEALANKRVYKTGRPDVHTAARNILFDVVDGVVPLYWAPPEPLKLAQQRDAERYAACWSTGARWCGARRRRSTASRAAHSQCQRLRHRQARMTIATTKAAATEEAKMRKRKQATEIKGTTALTAHPQSQRRKFSRLRTAEFCVCSTMF